MKYIMLQAQQDIWTMYNKDFLRLTVAPEGEKA